MRAGTTTNDVTSEVRASACTSRPGGSRGSASATAAVVLALAGATVALGHGVGMTHDTGAALPAGAPTSVVTTVTRDGASTAARSAATPSAAARAATARSSSRRAQVFAAPVVLPQSDDPNDLAAEPSVAIDGSGTIYVTGPTGIGRFTSTVPGGTLARTSPVWRSDNGGASFNAPVASAVVANQDGIVGGGDSDIFTDSAGDIFVTNLWLGNTDMSVSTDRGQTWTGIPYGHASPADDRPWFAYDAKDDAAYVTWDGFDGIHVAKALLRNSAEPGAAKAVFSLAFVQDVLVVPESAVVLGSDPSGGRVRYCVCPPGTMTVTPDGTVAVSYGDHDGVHVVSSSDGGLTWPNNAVIPNSGDGNDSTYTSHSFQVLKSDNDGNLYAAWTAGHVDGNSGSFTDAPQIYYSWLLHGSSTWHDPVQVSTTRSAMYGTLAVVSPGVVDIAYYGTDGTGNPYGASSKVSWNLYLAQARGTTVASAVALPSFYHGKIDRSLIGDFFSMIVDAHGMAGIITNAAAGSGYDLVYVRQVGRLS